MSLKKSCNPGVWESTGKNIMCVTLGAYWSETVDLHLSVIRFR